jgi:hypothetical protein
MMALAVVRELAWNARLWHVSSTEQPPGVTAILPIATARAPSQIDPEPPLEINALRHVRAPFNFPGSMVSSLSTG